MKQLFLSIFSLLACIAHASDTPLSGTFSNTKNSDTGGYNTTLKSQINLVVTVNKSGQQFFIQCLKVGKAGFGTTTTFKAPQQTATIKAGPECPAKEIQVELDYEGVIIRVGERMGYLPRGNVHVPIED
jgi:hypothetical protein